MNWYMAVLKNYAVFHGRARRKEYWMFFLVNMVIAVLLELLDAALGTMFIGMVYSLLVLIPGVAVTIRRLHDTGRSGWWFLVLFVPVIGVLVMLIFTLFDSEEGDNRYGPNPKYHVNHHF